MTRRDLKGCFLVALIVGGLLATQIVPAATFAWDISPESRVRLIGTSENTVPQVVAVDVASDAWSTDSLVGFPLLSLPFNQLVMVEPTGQGVGDFPASGPITLDLPLKLTEFFPVVLPNGTLIYSVGGTTPLTARLTTETPPFCDEELPPDVTFCQGAQPDADGVFRLVSVEELPDVLGASLGGQLFSLELIGALDPVGNHPPTAVITEPVGSASIEPGGALDFSGFGTDPNDDPITLEWAFPDCAIPSTSTAADVSSVVFDCLPDDYTVTLEVCDDSNACATAARTVTVLLPGSCTLIPQTGWTATATSEELDFPVSGAAELAIDGDPLTKWHSRWYVETPGHPHSLTVDLGAVSELCQFGYLARQDGLPNATIRDYTFEVSLTGLAGSWTEVASGQLFDNAGQAINSPEKPVPFAPTSGRYVRLTSINAVAADPSAHVAELRMWGSSGVDNLPPSVVITDPASDTSVVQGGGLDFSGFGVDPNGDPVTLEWTFPGCATPSTSSVTDVGPVVFDCAADDYTVTLEACDDSNACSTATRTITVTPVGDTCTLIPQTGWTATATSEELDFAVSGAAELAIDGDPLTKWHSQWFLETPGHPHRLTVDLGATFSLCQFGYRPRQDGLPNATIRDYTFEVSLTGLAGSWTEVAGGRLFENAAQAINGAERRVTFAPTSGRYVRLTSLNAVAGDPSAHVAELRMWESSGTGNRPPSAVITDPASDTSVVQGGALDFSASGVDPDGDPTTFEWTFPDCATPSTFGAADVGPVVFGCAPDDYIVTLEVCDHSNACSTATRTITVVPVGGACTLIPQTGWTATATSEELDFAVSGAAELAIDGDPLTKWHSQWFVVTPGHPHSLTVDLGATFSLCQFGYLPRQDGLPNATIRDYTFEVSLTGLAGSWTEVAGGRLFENAAQAINGAERLVPFVPTPGRYVRLTSINAVDADPSAHVAELRMWDTSGVGTNQPPSVVITDPASDTSAAQGGALDFSGFAVDPNGDPVTLEWTFPGCATPSTSSAADVGSVVFDCAADDYDVTLEACDDSNACSTATRTITVVPVGGVCTLVPQTGWTATATSEELDFAVSGAAALAIDGDPATKWHSRWYIETPEHPHSLTVDLGATLELCQFGYLPRQDGLSNATIRDYTFEVSLTGLAGSWTEVASGRLFENAALAINGPEKLVPFVPTTGRYVRLTSLSAVASDPSANIAELRMWDTLGTGNRPPSAVITDPANDTSVVQGGALDFSGFGVDPNGDPVTLEWTFPACATPSTSSVADVGPVIFGCAPDDYNVTLEACDDSNACSTATRAITVAPPGSCTVIPQTGWTATATSEELDFAVSGAAELAIDGDPLTKWHSQWFLDTPEHPHSLTVDLGATFELCQFGYLPRQDDLANATIRDYTFEVSLTGLAGSWTEVASGRLFENAAQAINGPERLVPFTPTSGRYVRLTSINAVSGNPSAHVAELRLWGN